jgi:hypothetical protein
VYPFSIYISFTCSRNINFTSLSSCKIKRHGACAAEEYRSSPAEEYQSPPGVPSQRVIVIGGVAGGSLACTFALGFLFVCFNKRERRSPEKDCSSTTSMSPAATVYGRWSSVRSLFGG